ncbi:MAG: M13 family metallopeptidase [Flammeovirgaceae bacterium]|jgi:putative endopeptidase|nr:M13 family metallopeptidase [Flammeovirgaceae bacterium]
MRNTFQFFLLFNFLLFVFLSCQTKTEQINHQNEWDVHAIDSAISPTTDFYHFVNGKWISKMNVLSSQVATDRFLELQANTDSVLLNVISQAGGSGQSPAGSDAQKVFQFFQSGIQAGNASIVAPAYLTEVKNRIFGLTSKNNIQRIVVDDVITGGNLFFELSVLPDIAQPTKAALYLKSAPLGLPDYYLLTQDAPAKNIRSAYFAYLVNLLMADGVEKAKAENFAAVALKIEVELAKGKISKSKSVNTSAEYKRIHKNELTSFLQFIDGTTFFEQAGIKSDTLLCSEWAYLTFCSVYFSKVSLDECKAYFYTAWLRKAAPYLPQKYATLHEQFYTQTLTGKSKVRTRSQLVLAHANAFLGDAIAQLYVKNQINPADKAYLSEMAENIRFTLAEKIKLVTWLSDSSKLHALHKLKNIKLKLAYPETYQDYVGLAFKTDSSASYLENVMLVKSYLIKKKWATVNQPINPETWTVTPQTINAFYDRQRNEIVIPAALLQEPFYYKRGNNAWNYGAIGTCIAHEFCHAFDFVGFQYSANGAQQTWLNSAEQNYLTNLAKAVDIEFTQATKGNESNKTLSKTLQENMADLAGLDLAYNAMQRYYRDYPERKDGDTGRIKPEQYFFIAYASAWRSYSPKTGAQYTMVTDMHSSPFMRVNKSLQNCDGYHQAFATQPGQAMFKAPEARIRIW